MTWISYETQLPPEECLRRIVSATEPDRFLSELRLREGVLAQVGDDRFRLRFRRKYIRNSFSRVLYARLKTTSAGSLIQVRTGLQPLVLVFSILWFGGVTLVGGLMMLVGILQLIGTMERAEGSPWLGIVMPPALLAFGLLLTRTGRSDAVELLQFMERVLETHHLPRAA